MEVLQIIIPIVAAIVYALAGFFKTPGQEFDVVKFGTTLVIGAIVGVVMFATGTSVTEEGVAAMIVTYGGIVVLIEELVKAVTRRLVTPA